MQKEKAPRQVNSIQDVFNIVKDNIVKKLKSVKGGRRRDMIARALTFSRSNKNVLIIIADPEKDDLFASYNTSYAAARIRSKYLRMNKGIVKSLIERDPEDKNWEKRNAEFLAFVDGFLFNLSKGIKNKEERSEQKQIEDNNIKKV